MNAAGIYRIAFGDRAYIGSAVNIRSRWGRHRFDLRRGQHHSGKLQNAWNKYGEAAFAFDVLLVCAASDMALYEQRAIDAFRAVAVGFNIAPLARTTLGCTHSDETRKKLSDAAFERARTRPKRVGFKLSQETKDKIGAANRGLSRSEETHAKLRLARRGKRPALGMKHSPETRARMSASHKDPATRERWLAAMRPYWALNLKKNANPDAPTSDTGE